MSKIIPEGVPEKPIEAVVPPPRHDADKEAAMRAAVFYDRAQQERDEHMRLLEQSKVAIQVQDNQINSLKLELATERNRYDALQNSYNEKVQDCADLEAILASVQGVFEDHAARLGRFEFSRLKRRRNGGAKRSEPVSDPQSGEGPLAELSSLVAHRKPVLGQSEDSGG